MQRMILPQMKISYFKDSFKILKFRLSSLFYQEDLRFQRNILQTAISRLQEGLFYYDPNSKKMLLTERFQKFLKVDKRILNFPEYLSYLHPADHDEYLKMVTTQLKKVRV